MFELKYPHLFAPIVLGKTMFRNRLFASPTGYHYLAHNQFPNQQMAAFYELKARGGAASVSVGDCVVDTRTGLVSAYQIKFDDSAILPSMTDVASAITRHGAVASIELNHGGIYSHFTHEQGLPLYGPVAMAIPDEHKINNDGHEVKKSGDGLIHILEMTEEQIVALAESFGKAARLAKQCGFGMITLHGGHGWLLTQFMSPYINTRKDGWGGSTEGRMRFPLAVVESVRRAVGPGFPIEMRISGAECILRGYDIDEGIRIAKMLDGKVDLIHVSAGHHESEEASQITHPSMFLEDGVNVRYAAEIKKHVNTPVATVGALLDPQMMEEIIASGKADVVQVARGFLADPDLPIKARSGREKEINTCLRCYECFAHSTSTRIHYCAINPVVGHELENKYDIPSAVEKTVLVAGGGIAGMQAAITAAGRGHRVILCEKTDRLGGVLRCEEAVPFKARLGEYLDRQAERVQKAGVDVRLNRAVTTELAKELAPDVIIAALGAKPVVPNIPGIDRTHVLGVTEAYRSEEQIGRRVVILGGGLAGTELAVWLASLGRDVAILEMLPALNDGGNMVHGGALKTQIRKLGITLALSTKALEINDEAVIGESPSGKCAFPADTVVVAVGLAPLWEEAGALSAVASEFHQLGDCLSPRNILQATQAAYTIARDIGRI
jgi:2,4-dienoyl-CoA reductase-like NADH-dependent reductase (Old Yellow Enzyme family)/thioredoxin reductase